MPKRIRGGCPLSDLYRFETVLSGTVLDTHIPTVPAMRHTRMPCLQLHAI